MSTSNRGISVRVNPFFFLLIFLIGWINTFTIPGTLVWAVVIFVSVLFHEFGHAFTAILFGQRADIELYGMGGVTRRSGANISAWKEFLIVFNGPFFGFVLFVLSYQLYVANLQGISPLVLEAIKVSTYINAFWTLVNLLPILPLDGGHLMRIILEGMLGVRGIKLAYFFSMVLAGFFSLIFILRGTFIIGAIFFMFTFESFRNWKEIRALTPQDQDLDRQNEFKQAEEWLHHGNLDQAYFLFKKIRDETKEGILYLAATEYLAAILSEKGQVQEAYTILEAEKKKISPESARLLHKLAFQTKRWKEAIAMGNDTYQDFPDYETALINSISHAAIGDVQPAVGWLQTAVDQGLPNVKEIVQLKEYDPIRESAEFRKF